MEKFVVSPEFVQSFNYDSADLPESVRREKPVIYLDVDVFCCVSGKNPVEGEFGSGPTPEDAVIDWAENYKNKMGKGGCLFSSPDIKDQPPGWHVRLLRRVKCQEHVKSKSQNPSTNG